MKRYILQEICEEGWANMSKAISLYDCAHLETDFSSEEFDQIAALEVNQMIVFEGGACPAFRLVRVQ